MWLNDKLSVWLYALWEEIWVCFMGKMCLYRGAIVADLSWWNTPIDYLTLYVSLYLILWNEYWLKNPMKVRVHLIVNRLFSG